MTVAAFEEWSDESRALAEEAAPAVAEVVRQDADVRVYAAIALASRDTISEVWDLHSHRDPAHRHRCAACGKTAPCPTRRILDGHVERELRELDAAPGRARHR